MKKGIVAVIITTALIAGASLGLNAFQAKNFAGDPPVGIYHY